MEGLKISAQIKSDSKKHLSPSRQRALCVFFVQISRYCNQGASPGWLRALAGDWPFHFVQSFAKKCKNFAQAEGRSRLRFKPPNPKAIRGRRSFLKVNGLFFWVAFVKRREQMKSVLAIWSKAFSPDCGVFPIAFIFVRAVAVIQSKTQRSLIHGGSENSFFESRRNQRALRVRRQSEGGSEAAYTALTGHHSAGFSCQAMIADSRHPTRPGEMRTGLGNRPSFMARQMVECERDVTSITSLSRMKRSSLLTLRSYDLNLCETPKLMGC
jgi:hypothetical protein